MNNAMLVSYDSIENLTHEDDGHYHLKIPMFYENKNYSNYRVDFIFDTGAFITVITKDTAEELGFTGLHTIMADVPLSGFMGGCQSDIKEIPGFLLGGKFLEGVKVAVPREATDTNILGLNVIEYYRYFVDTENDKIYFSINPKPDIPAMLRCGNISVISNKPNNPQ